MTDKDLLIVAIVKRMEWASLEQVMLLYKIVRYVCPIKWGVL